jgi:hypothetical protein
MPQQTNLNVAPYFDDFDPTNDYQKVLFKPGYPVQARELTTLQSILQNQVEKFGQHFFKEGAKVIPGNIGYSQLYYAVQLANTFQGVPVEAYVDQLVGTTITGQTSGVTAVVDNILSSQDSERGSVTLYVSYSGSSRLDNTTQTFSDGESLTCNQVISSGLLGNSTISSGTPFANTISSEASSTGSVFQIEEGVYFIRGYFVNVNKESLILDQYSNRPSYRVGLFVSEEVINANADESLTDNSQGFNNYGAPGADRLQISVSLFKKSIDDFNDDNFVELATIVNGDLKVSPSKSGSSRANGAIFHSDLTDVLARRTFDESGHYIVKPFNVSIVNSLNDNLGNRGLYEPGQFTPGGTAANADLALCRLSPGKAYVKGYEIETTSNTIIDVPKPRTTKTIENQFINYNTGPTLKLNSVYRSPTVGVGNTFILSLRDERVGVNSETAPGKEIGFARVFDFRLESGSYNSALPDDNEWGMSMYDIQPFTEIEVNESISLTIPSYVEGSNSGATAFLRSPVVGTALTVYDKKGEFIKNETLVFRSGISTQSIAVNRVAKTITPYGISNVKSVYSNTGIAADPDNQENIVGINTFSANVVQTPSATIGIASVTALSDGISTVTSSNKLFPGNIKANSLLQYSDISISDDPITAKVVSVGSSHITVTGVTTVTGVVNGKLPENNFTTSDLELLTTQLDVSSDNTLFTILPKQNIAAVNLTDAEIHIRKTFTVTIANNQLDSTSLLTVTLPEGETYLSYSDERYTLIRSDGVTESLSADKFQFSSDLREVQIRNLGTDNQDAQLIVTAKKSNIKSKKKIKNRVKTLVVDKSINPASGIGSTTLNDGLSYGDYAFGTRVQDNLISLNTPDVIRIHGIYETSDASLIDTDFGSPEMSLTQLNGPTASTGDMIIGELLVGQTSGAVAVFGEVKNSSDLRYLPKNNFKFIEGEVVVFQESLIQGVISSLNTTSFNIASNYTFASGQRNTTYNYGSLTRKSDSNSPKNKIKIYYKSASFDPSDDGDIVTVESYNDFNYSTEVKTFNGVLNTDLIDLRPRVSDYTVTTSSRSPLEFLGRSFNGLGNSIPNILASDETIFLDFSYYQGRVDRLFLNKDGAFQFKLGVPSDDPNKSKPGLVDSAIEIAEIRYPPYLHNTQQASVKFLKYKRFQMKDIKKLEDRIRSLEYYTQLSLLEANTANQFISDANGLNRFKSGFFVDNFTSVSTQDLKLGQRNSIDQTGQILRPKHITNAPTLITGPVVDVDSTADQKTSEIEGVNVRKQGDDTVTLEYSEIEWKSQVYATRTESVTPFLISFWQGTITLSPSSDNWVTTTKMEAKTIDSIGNYSQIMSEYNEKYEIDPETGFASSIWNSWEQNWSGVTEVVPDVKVDQDTTTGAVYGRDGWINGGSGVAKWVQDTTTQTFEQDVNETVEYGKMKRSGTRPEVIETYEKVELGEKVVSTEIGTVVRSRNVEFYSENLKPSTRIYAFLDGKDVTKFCVPKLIEISMTSGTFEIGETVEGRTLSIGLSEEGKNTDPKIDFRVAQSNHRKGDYDSPTQVYPDNPYVEGGTIPELYSSTSTILNVDTYSLSNLPQGEFFGYIQTGMVLTGKTSGAEAKVTDVRLISDTSSALVGSLFIPDPNNGDNPQFECGTNIFTLTNDPENDQNAATTIGEQAYPTSGLLETVQDQILSIRNASIENRQVFQEGEDIQRVLDIEFIGEPRNVGEPVVTETIVGYYDPLAQSFFVDQKVDGEGVFITKCDLFFRTKDDDDTPLRFQIRTMKDGFPTPKYLNQVVLYPDDINTSTDGSVATTVQFPPLFLESGNEFAICLISNSKKYSVYISRVGENDVLTDTYVSDQPSLGSLFKSQNARTWEASQWEDLKYTLYRADFVESGTIDLYNPELSEGNQSIASLMENPLNISSKEIRVGLGTTIADNRYVMGNTFSQVSNTTTTGDLVGVAASATGTMTITNPGIGYTPADGSTTFSGVNLVTISGSGSGAVADVSIQDGVAIAATISGNGGNGYEVGDVVSIDTIGAANVGRNARFTLTSIGHTSQLIFNNVQGDFVTGAGGTLTFFDSTGVLRELNSGTFNGSTFGGDVTINESTEISDGLHVKVNHVNHGMNFDDNFVRIVGILPDVKPTKLTAEYSKSSTDPISVSSGTGDIFNTFENVSVGSTNTGLILIGEEIIEYTSTSASTIGGNISRGTTPKTYPIGTPVYKYELSGVSLARLNKTHDLNDVTIADPINLDSYHIKLDMSEKHGTSGQSANADRSSLTSGFPKLFIGATDSTGGSNIQATKNIPFEIIKPAVHGITPEGTTITGQIRTTTSQSISGNEIPYVNVGFEDVTLNENNYLDSSRAIFSKVNEDRKLSSVEGNKSFQMKLSLGTADSRLSPQIDLTRAQIYTISNRVNSKILNYAEDSRVNTVFNDPSACQYISKEITIANSASSLQILADVQLPAECDIRAFYCIGGEPGFEPIFTPFPGYLNLNSRGLIINEEDSDGRTDVLVPSSNKRGFGISDTFFREHKFSVDNLPSFRCYRIKLVMTSTNQVLAPQLKDLRVIALA